MNQHPRLLSLDAFRGATIAAMILVNNPGSWNTLYPQLRHAAWNGWTMTDMIFPFFLWIVGVAMVFSFTNRAEAGDSKGVLLLHIVRRSIVIFAIGVFLNGFPFGFVPGHSFSWSSLRIPGVLQRIAACYLLGGTIVLYTKPRGQTVWIIVLLVGYWMLKKYVVVPGYGAGVLDPTGNLCRYVDSTLLAGHTWLGAPASGFDPEGIVSTFPAVATLLFGVLTGDWLQSRRTPETKTAWMFVAGNALLLLGAILDSWFPINKNLWTTSFCIFMAGWATICFGMLYWLIDANGYRKWTIPMVMYGVNAIAVYVLAGLSATLLDLIRWSPSVHGAVTLKSHLYDTFFIPYFSPFNASLFFAIAFMLVMFVAVWVMWRIKWYIKI